MEKKLWNRSYGIKKDWVNLTTIPKEGFRTISHGLGLFKPYSQWTIGQVRNAVDIIKKKIDNYNNKNFTMGN